MLILQCEKVFLVGVYLFVSCYSDKEDVVLSSYVLSHQRLWLEDDHVIGKRVCAHTRSSPAKASGLWQLVTDRHRFSDPAVASWGS